MLYEHGFGTLVRALKTDVGKLLLPHVISELQKLTGTERRVVARWLEDEKPPKGLFRIKMTFFLDAIGISIAELESQAEPVKLIFLGLGSGVISLDEARKMMGYKDEALVRRALRLHFNAAPKAVRSAERAITKVEHTIRDCAKQKTAEIRNIPKEMRSAVINGIAAKITDLNPALDFFTLDLFTEKDRESLREATDGKGPFNLMSAAILLCAEESHQ